MGRRESIMKLVALALASAHAVQMDSMNGMDWPASGVAGEPPMNTCGSRVEFSVLTNATCAIYFAESPAWINAGGIFTTKPGDTSAIYVHTYDYHGEGMNGKVPITLQWEVPPAPEDYTGWPYPEVWAENCHSYENVTMDCQPDNGQIEGLYMMPFNFASGNNNSTYALGVKNTEGHLKDNMYTVTLNDRNGTPVQITDIQVQADPEKNIVMADGDNGKFTVILNEDYNGEMLMINFRNKNPTDMGQFEGAQSFYSTIQGGVVPSDDEAPGY